MTQSHSQIARVALVVPADQLAHHQRALEKVRHDSPKPGAPITNPVHVTVDKQHQLLVHLLCDSDPDLLTTIRAHPFGTILLDNRGAGNSLLAQTLAGRLLPSLLSEKGPRGIDRRKILVILNDNRETGFQGFMLGTLQLGGVLIEPGSLEEILIAAYRQSRPTQPGKVALCLAGGGIEGLFWEIGVLRAIDTHLKGRALIDFDIFSGISAGAVLAAFLANGVRPFEVANALYGDASRIDPITRGMLFEPNVKELLARMIASFGLMMKGRWITSPLDSAMRVTPTAIFSGEKLKSYLQKQFEKPGLTNDFQKLGKQLFIGATDQDEGAHVSFGTPGFDQIPISTAVRASTAMTPYYSPEKIGDHYFVDGIFTRTIDIDIAMANGATLIICVDPLQPVQTMQSGYVSEKGGLFNTVQSVKSMIRSRLSEMLTKAEESHPEVSLVVFSPTARDMEQMSGTMMRFLYSPDTEKMAFESASQQITEDYDWLAEELERHQLQLTKPEKTGTTP